MLVCTLGDAVLDVIVLLERDLVSGADVPARTTVGAGGQAANVAAWVVALGARARFVGVRAADDAGRLAERALATRGVETAGPARASGGGVVVSLVAPGGERTMASDRGVSATLRAEEVDPSWLECDHLHLSGYALAAEPMRAAAARAVGLARGHGASVSIDIGAWTLVDSIGAGAFRSLLSELAPDVVFCNEEEDAAVGGPIPEAVWVVKRGATGATVDGRHHDSTAARVVDTTGAGDAFAAGWIVGGISAALEAAARCVSKPGAMPD